MHGAEKVVFVRCSFVCVIKAIRTFSKFLLILLRKGLAGLVRYINHFRTQNLSGSRTIKLTFWIRIGSLNSFRSARRATLPCGCNLVKPKECRTTVSSSVASSLLPNQLADMVGILCAPCLRLGNHNRIRNRCNVRSRGRIERLLLHRTQNQVTKGGVISSHDGFVHVVIHLKKPNKFEPRACTAPVTGSCKNRLRRTPTGPQRNSRSNYQTFSLNSRLSH